MVFPWRLKNVILNQNMNIFVAHLLNLQYVKKKVHISDANRLKDCKKQTSKLINIEWTHELINNAYVITKMEEFYWKCNCYNKNTAFKMYTNQNTLQLIILNIDFSTEKIQIYQPVDLKTMKN